MKQFTHTIQDELGIHARPAGQLAKLAKSFPGTTATLIREDRSAVLAECARDNSLPAAQSTRREGCLFQAMLPA